MMWEQYNCFIKCVKIFDFNDTNAENNMVILRDMKSYIFS